MTEADTEDLLLHGVEWPEEGDEVVDPPVVAVGVAAAAGDDEPIVRVHVRHARQLAMHGAVDVPRLVFLPQQPHEHLQVPSVGLLHVLGLVGAE